MASFVSRFSHYYNKFIKNLGEQSLSLEAEVKLLEAVVTMVNLCSCKNWCLKKSLKLEKHPFLKVNRIL